MLTAQRNAPTCTIDQGLFKYNVEKLSGEDEFIQIYLGKASKQYNLIYLKIQSISLKHKHLIFIQSHTADSTLYKGFRSQTERCLTLTCWGRGLKKQMGIEFTHKLRLSDQCVSR